MDRLDGAELDSAAVFASSFVWAAAARQAVGLGLTCLGAVRVHGEMYTVS